MAHDHATKVPRKVYEPELMRLQAELVKLKEWVRMSGLRVVVVFEGRDAAGKGGAIKRISEYLNPRAARIVALPAPPNASAGSGTSSATSRICRRQERSSCSIAAGTTARASSMSWGSAHRPSTGASCTSARSSSGSSSRTGPARQVLVLGERRGAGAALSLSHGGSAPALEALADGPAVARPRGRVLTRQGRDVRAHRYSRGPLYVVEGDDKRRARLNCIAHLLSLVPYDDVLDTPLELPPRPPEVDYERPPRDLFRYVPDSTAALLS